ncbi:hypothetical protein BEWA_028460 [Theileria equi strain WA]|uniref:Uncharacterized protein n=1 Tax=Theileria equi strain WA TaxID=1537102 RepID=L0AYB1_THEEQ|nr:hypothetical protein BEWA_028460 [Theileria equi strain WA]AFZ79996.1 hypothetical protein BEWA_028460 [Theileria equi strain WA]|eukprot:XP_004829662.1 hypothetical protein BEWA_028460 [Theileria equi strain WA]
MTSLSIIDVDELVFEHRTILVNYLGTIANAIDDILISPWSTANDSVDTEDASPKEIQPMDRIAKSDSHMLREAIKMVLKSSSSPSQSMPLLTPEIVKETLCILTDVLEKYDLVHAHRLQTLSDVYNGAKLYALRAGNGVAYKEKVHEWDNSRNGMLCCHLQDVLLLGWLWVSLEKLCSGNQVDFEYFFGVSDENNDGETVVLVTMFKEAVDAFIKSGGKSVMHDAQVSIH